MVGNFERRLHALERTAGLKAQVQSEWADRALFELDRRVFAAAGQSLTCEQYAARRESAKRRWAGKTAAQRAQEVRYGYELMGWLRQVARTELRDGKPVYFTFNAVEIGKPACPYEAQE